MKKKMPTPVPVPPTCDVPGCGRPSDLLTDGSEIDIQGLQRPSISKINVCVRHHNWPHSEDAVAWAATNADYKKRK